MRKIMRTFSGKAFERGGGGGRRGRPFLCLLGLLLVGAVPAFGQDHQVSGTVTDAETGVPLPGVNVVVKGTITGTATDADGAYELTVPSAQDTLVFSFIGYEMQEVAIAGRSTVDVALPPSISALNQVVVVGYGTEERGNVTGSVGEVSSEKFDDRAITNAVNALQGQIAGVTVIQRSGEPGADGGTIRVRGITTLGNNDPLVLVDGIPSSLSAVAPSDIKSISVLKDAAAAAIYGVRASAGVILVTTKSGQRGEGIQFSYSGYMGTQTATRLPDYLGSYRYAILYNEARVNVGMEPLYTEEDIQKFRSGKYPNTHPNTQWLDMLLKDYAFQQSHYFALSGGLEKTRYRVSFRYLDQNGLVPNVNAEEFNARVNLDTDINDRLSFSVRAAGVRGLEHRTHLDPGFLIRATGLRPPPTVVGRYTDGTWGFYKAGWNGLRMALESGGDTWKETRLRLSSSAEYELLDGLSVKGRFGLRTYNSIRSFFRAQIKYREFVPGEEQGEVIYVRPPTHLRNASHYEQTITMEGFLNYEQTFGNHHVKGLLGYSQQAFRLDWFAASRDDFPNNRLREINAGDSATDGNEGSAAEWGIRSFFGQLTYSFLGRYLFEASLRYDGTSRFPKAHRYALFPSFSAGWRISEEPFFDGVDFINNLKLRASWGRLGNQEIGRYPYQTTYQLTEYTFGGQLTQGIVEARLPNKDITWETTTVTDVGVDAELFEGRLALTAEYFIKNTEGILLNLPVPWTLGIGAPPQNAANVKNWGWEFSLGYQDQWGDISYGVAGNLSVLQNEITDLAGTSPSPYWGRYVRAVGLPIGSYYGYEALGLFQSEEEVANHARQNPFTSPGDIKYKDQNGDGIINGEDRVYIGDYFPNLTYGLTLTAGYKGFDFRVFLQGVGQVQMYLTKEAAWAFFNGGKALEWHWDRWSPENRDASYPRVTLNRQHNWRASSFWVQDASYLRVKNVQLGYSLPESFLKRFGVQQLRLYVNADDLFTFSDFRNFDPEAPNGRGSFYPNVTTYTFGINLTL